MNVTDATAIHSMDEIFTQLSPQDESTLISLPYRIGLYVSYSDVSGGWDAQEKELQSLSGILREYSEDFCKTEFTQKVLMETLIRRSDWPSWAHNIETVPEQAGTTIQKLLPLFSEKDLKAFKEVLVDIALSVAMAFHEGRDVDLDNVQSQSSGLMSGLLSKLKGKKVETSSLDHMHISRNERAALLRVCDAMNYKLQR